MKYKGTYLIVERILDTKYAESQNASYSVFNTNILVLSFKKILISYN